ncbi:ComEC/Rec2 family competence protein, partial [Salmonella enterica]|uniref:ComEC/Rec2 family competence protein n=1 Tax=Salmonella enterica TaxID=28901 RepID=UPI0022B73884|nr:ComEC/Rec2 family competence protein [Salmonella enterica]
GLISNETNDILRAAGIYHVVSISGLHMVLAAGVVFCSPIYWYGLSAQTKAFFDRMFCYYAASHPDSANVMPRLARKRLGLVLASEESYAGAALGIVHQLQEYARYTDS